MSAKEDNLRLYEDYNKTLRTWLVGFGFGVPATFIINTAAQDKLITSENPGLIIWLFLLGTSSQIAIAFINKVISWCAYQKHEKGQSCNVIAGRIAMAEDWFLLDVLMDFLSLIFFGWSIILILNIFITA